MGQTELDLRRAKPRCAESCRSSCKKRDLCKTFSCRSSCKKEICAKLFAVEAAVKKENCAKLLAVEAAAKKEICYLSKLFTSSIQLVSILIILILILMSTAPGNVRRVWVREVSIGRHRASSNISGRVQVRHLGIRHSMVHIEWWAQLKDMAMLSASFSFVSGDNQLNYHCGYDLFFFWQWMVNNTVRGTEEDLRVRLSSGQ